MDASNSDADFDSYWEDQSRNRNRNRIRVGRQYQATVPPLLKPGEIDDRCCEDLETLKWKPDNDLSDQQIDQYLSMASRAVSLFAKAFDTCQNTGNGPDKTLQTALRGLSDFVTSHHPYHHDAGCQVPSHSCCGDHNCKHNVANGWTPTEAHLFAQALEACGKNFSAIKKDYLPWKPVRSIIEFYYHGKSEKLDAHYVQQSQDINTSVDLMVEKDNRSWGKEPKAEGKETDDESVDNRLEECDDNKQDTVEVKCEDDDVSSEMNCKKSLKSKVAQSKNESSSSSSSNLGSLSFFLGGQLVLKLNAQQESSSNSQNCQWVLSQDTPKLPPNRKNRKSKKNCKSSSITSLTKDDCHHGQDDKKLDFSSDGKEEGSVVKKAKLKSDCLHSSSPVEEINEFCGVSWLPPAELKKERIEKCDDSSFKTENWCKSFSSLCLSQCKNENCNHNDKNCVKNSNLVMHDNNLTNVIKTEPALSPSYVLNSSVSPKEEDTKESVSVSSKPYLKNSRTVDVKHGNVMSNSNFSTQNLFLNNSVSETSSTIPVPSSSLSSCNWLECHSSWKNSAKFNEISKKEAWISGLKLQDLLDGSPLDLSTKAPLQNHSFLPTQNETTEKSLSVCNPPVSDAHSDYFKSSICQKQNRLPLSTTNKDSPSLNDHSHTNVSLDAWNAQASHGLPYIKTDGMKKDYHDSRLLNKNYPLGCGYSRYGMTVAYAPTVFPPIYNCNKDHANKDKPVNLSKKHENFECDESNSIQELEIEERCSENDLVPWMVAPIISYSQLHSSYCSCCVAFTDTTGINKSSDQPQGDSEVPLDLSSCDDVDAKDFQKTDNIESVID